MNENINKNIQLKHLGVIVLPFFSLIKLDPLAYPFKFFSQLWIWNRVALCIQNLLTPIGVDFEGFRRSTFLCQVPCSFGRTDLREMHFLQTFHRQNDLLVVLSRDFEQDEVIHVEDGHGDKYCHEVT